MAAKENKYCLFFKWDFEILNLQLRTFIEVLFPFNEDEHGTRITPQLVTKTASVTKVGLKYTWLFN